METVHITVTAEDIREAKSDPSYITSNDKCMVANALRRKFPLAAVGGSVYSLDGVTVKQLPKFVQEKIREYVYGKDVNPFSFSLEV